MPCYVPFNNRNLNISFFALRPVGVLTEELIATMKYMSFQAEDFGCVSSSIFKSIHGNLIVWYGAWLRRSEENQKMLHETLVSAMSQLSNLAILAHHGFFQVHHGESRDGRLKAKFSSGDTIFLGAMFSTSEDISNLSCACVRLLRSCFSKENGVSSSVCFQCPDTAVVATLQVWESLQACYSWLITSDYRNTIGPHISGLSDDALFDVFKVIYVSNEEVFDMDEASGQRIGGP